ncbi:Kelch-like protein 10 like protein [Argiope bruennichi]|uniref:Kelch-like protein 10 like protein n=1 Tax=Argiope bruennichi TaxID=94029 RepID=A0A8T0G581_ARGBR|nr:Kelch-like protein 10 like protein [Argiope bruennichi]
MTDFNQQRLVTFKELLDSEELVNLTLVTEDGGQLKVHLELLAAISPYFRRMIDSCKNSAWETIHVPGTSKDTLSEIVNYIYTGKLCLREDKVKALIDAAELLQVPGVVKLCKQFLASTITVSNCISRYNFANCYQYSDLKEKAITFILANFEDVYKTNTEYSDLHIDDLLAILNSDTLNVKEEETVYWAMLKWVDADSDNRILHLSSILRCLRIGLCNFKAYHGMIWHQQKIYVIGGFDGNQCFNSVRCYDPVTYVWEEKGCMYVQRCYVSVAAVGEYLYALGGYDGHRRNKSCERYDSNRNQWSFIANMHNIRSDASADSLDGKIYIAGGFNGTQVLDSAECYDPETNEWTLIPNMNTPRSGVKVVAFRNYLFVIGGFNGSNRLSTVERYDKVTKMWTFVAPMLGPRSNFATAIINDLLYAIGGFNGLSTIASAELYDPVSNSWQPVTDLNLNRSALAACKVSNISTAQEYTYIGSLKTTFGVTSWISRNEDCHGILYQASQLFADLQNGDSPQTVYDLHHPFLRPRVPNEIIFVMGGWSAGSATNIMETYDCKTQRWFLALNSDTIPSVVAMTPQHMFGGEKGLHVRPAMLRPAFAWAVGEYCMPWGRIEARRAAETKPARDTIPIGTSELIAHMHAGPYGAMPVLEVSFRWENLQLRVVSTVPVLDVRRATIQRRMSGHYSEYEYPSQMASNCCIQITFCDWRIQWQLTGNSTGSVALQESMNSG